MIGKIEHDVLVQHYIGNTRSILEQTVLKRFFTLAFALEHVREIHKMAEIMDTAARYQAFITREVELAHEVIEQPFVHLLVENKTYGLAFTAVFYAFFDLLNDGGGNVVIDIDFGILGHFEHPASITVIAEI